MTGRTRDVRDIPVPAFLYGTAWKEERTEGLVRQALAAGFRGIDTANQRRHYHEEGVGRALARALDGGELSRDDLFVQTKFTHLAGQDHRVPYDPRAPVAEQVTQSFESSLEHLGLDRVDSLVLHGPSQGHGLGQADRDAWRAMESIHGSGRVRLLGISNVTAEQTRALCRFASVEVAFVQNRCFAWMAWDAAVREVCDAEGIVYQGFSLLTANREALRHDTMRRIADRHDATLPQVVFRFALDIGMIPLTGTTDPNHMREDLGIHDFRLTDDEVREIERIAA